MDMNPMKHDVGLVGSYRKGGYINSTINEVLDGIDAVRSGTARVRPYEIARRSFDGSFEQRGENNAHGQHDGDSPYGHWHIEAPSLRRSGDPGDVLNDGFVNQIQSQRNSAEEETGWPIQQALRVRIYFSAGH